MPISEWFEKLGRTIFESPFGAMDGAKDTPEIAEIRLALLDEVKAKSHRTAGRDVFPYNHVRLHLSGVPEKGAAVFEGQFFAQFCEDELKSGLVRSKYRFPDDLQVEVATSSALPGPGEPWVWIETGTRAKAAEPAPKRGGKLIVASGEANVRDMVLGKARINIGRGEDVYRTDGPSRRNDIAFKEAGDLNRTVSREHAHILYAKKSAECLLFNDRVYTPGSKSNGNCGLWVIRDGLSIEVHKGAKGFPLQAGDEIHLGRAVLRYAVK